MVRGAGSKLVGASGVIFLHAAHTPVSSHHRHVRSFLFLSRFTLTRTDTHTHTASLAHPYCDGRSLVTNMGKEIHAGNGYTAYTLRCARTQRLAQLSWFEAPPRLFGFSSSVNLGQ